MNAGATWSAALDSDNMPAPPMIKDTLDIGAKIIFILKLFVKNFVAPRRQVSKQ